MKSSFFSFGLLAASANANIIFNWVQPTCNHTEVGRSNCLRGQHCTEADSCEASLTTDDDYSRSFVRSVAGSVDIRAAAAYSQDGKCGPSNGDLLCDPNSTVYKGTCCSQHGWVRLLPKTRKRQFTDDG